MHVKVKATERAPSGPDVLKEMAFRVTADEAVVREVVFRAVVQAKPKGMPQWLWKRLLRLTLVMQEQEVSK